MLFRAADKNCEKKVKSEEFRNFLSKLNLGLS